MWFRDTVLLLAAVRATKSFGWSEEHIIRSMCRNYEVGPLPARLVWFYYSYFKFRDLGKD